MRKASGIFTILVGVSMVGMWGMLYCTGQIVELATKPVEISFHLVSELATAVLLIVGGYALLTGKAWAGRLWFLSMGMLLYSPLNANGYCTQMGAVPMTIMFSALTVMSMVGVIGLARSGD